MRDDRTGRGFKLPHKDNSLQDDVGRLREALTAIDGEFGSAREALLEEVNEGISGLRGAPGGLAPLGESGRLPGSFLPDGLERTASKGIAGGYAGLGTAVKVPAAQLPDFLMKSGGR